MLSVYIRFIFRRKQVMSRNTVGKEICDDTYIMKGRVKELECNKSHATIKLTYSEYEMISIVSYGY